MANDETSAKECSVENSGIIENLRFAGHGTTCVADHDFGTDFGRCGNPAYTIVHYKGLDRPVCLDHYKRMSRIIDEAK